MRYVINGTVGIEVEYLVSIRKWTGTHSALANLVEIKAREKFNRRHMGDIPRIKFFAQH